VFVLFTDDYFRGKEFLNGVVLDLGWRVNYYG